MRKSRLFFCVVFVLLLISIAPLFMACGDGHHSDSPSATSTPMTLDNAQVAVVLADIGDKIPGCTSSTPQQDIANPNLAAVATLSSASRSILASISPLGLQSEQLSSIRAVITPSSGTKALPGDCGGLLTMVSEHSSGSTTVNLTFDDYCTSLRKGTENETTEVINGTAVVKDIGTPSDLGPVTSKLTMPAADLAIENSDGWGANLTVRDAIYTFGVPGVEPGVPTVNAPDLLTMTSFVFKDKDTEKETIVQNLDISVWKNDTGISLLQINGGRYINEKGESLDISTIANQPLGLNELGVAISGSIVFTGKNGFFTLTPDTSGTNNFDVALDGTPLDRTLDCSLVTLPTVPVL